uniref:protein transport Sec1a-like n=1 Tax=Erigeron canadensis TaxID=72917 RepID=UPI001CB91DAD|nr:protein transport Sec1a-like [Erigeron canadensis]
MSVSDSETSSHGGDHKMFRQVTRDRLLYEMIKKSSSTKGGWKVLIMDKVTIKVMSSSCKMADITDQGVSLVEQLHKGRETMAGMDAIYYIQPSKENLIMFISDMSGREPLYKKAFVFFSSPIPKDFVSRIKADSSVVPRIGALREMNLEYFPIDNQAFVTDQGGALEELYGEDVENTREFDICLNTMATRIATVFASLKELPIVRYRVKGKQGSTFRDLLPKKLAKAIWDLITPLKASIPQFPQSETCELLILDRSVDLVAPIIHEWTYDAMCHDLVDLDGNKYVMEVPSKSGGPPEKKEFLLEDHDPVWLEMRHLHIADASERLSDKMDNLMSKNKAAQLQQKDSSELSTRDIQKMVQALPEYNQQMEKLSLHVEIAGKINKVISEEGLRDLGQIEQDLVFGDAGNKELITFLEEYEGESVENKLRLMMIYALADPEKFEGEKGAKLMELANLSPDTIRIIENMRLLEGPTRKAKPEKSGGFLNFDRKAKTALRKDRKGEEETWALFRFFPVLEELLEKIEKHELPKDEFESINEPGPGTRGVVPGKAAQSSRRSRRPQGKFASDDGTSSDSVLKNAANDLKHMGQRIFVFIIGGATRSELRVCHKLTSKLRREVILGSTCIDDPPQYITKVKMLCLKEFGGW